MKTEKVRQRGTVICCPRCGGKIRVPDALLGRWVACPRCAMEFAAMDPNSPTESESCEPEPTPEQAPLMRFFSGLSRGDKPHSPLGLASTLLGVVSLVLFCLGLIGHQHVMHTMSPGERAVFKMQVRSGQNPPLEEDPPMVLCLIAIATCLAGDVCGVLAFLQPRKRYALAWLGLALNSVFTGCCGVIMVLV